MSIESTEIRPITPAESAVPSRWAALIFALKVVAHRARRSLREWRHAPPRLAKGTAGEFTVANGVSETGLWLAASPQEQALQMGKVQNLRRAASALNGLIIPQGALFSFWKQIGRASRARGYVKGRMLQQGCMVPAIGGGLCQLSNALYDVALQAGCQIVERHAHSRIVPGSQAAIGRDATVAWNYVDLRFRAPRDLRLQAVLDRDRLTLSLSARTAIGDRPAPAAPSMAFEMPGDLPRSCETCQELDCFRHGQAPPAVVSRVAFVLDGASPELASYVGTRRRRQDVLAIPIDGRKWRLPRYGWPTQGFAAVHTAPVATLRRSLQSRRLAEQGAARQRALLEQAERLAISLAKQLPTDAAELCVAQSLLPFLWRDGHLGGRGYSVLMSRLPMDVLQARLDEALTRHPESPTLGDFRAPPELVAAERAALDCADSIVTANAEIAALFADKAQILAWHSPRLAAPSPAPAGNTVAFAGPTLGRKGAYEMREAARNLALQLIVPASDLEGKDFWDGLNAQRRPQGEPAWRAAAIVVQPAYAEENPRPLLAALAAGRRVIATQACGLQPQPGLTLVPFGDVSALVAALRAALKSRPG